MPAASPRAPLPCKHLSVTIQQPAAAVYDFLKDPANWVHWASGLGELQQDAATGTWTARQPAGVMTMAFTAPNEFGILDHSVTTPEGTVIHVAMRSGLRGVLENYRSVRACFETMLLELIFATP